MVRPSSPFPPDFLTNLSADPPRKEEYRPAPGSDTTSFSSTPSKTSDVGDLDASEMLNEDEDDEDEFTYAEDLVRYIRNGEGGDWFCIGVAGTSRSSVEAVASLTDELATYRLPDTTRRFPDAGIGYPFPLAEGTGRRGLYHHAAVLRCGRIHPLGRDGQARWYVLVSDSRLLGKWN